MLAADGFARGGGNRVIAKDLRVGVRSVERWRRLRREGGVDALRPSGPAKRPKVDDSGFDLLEPLLLEGARAQGWADERWTLSRVRLLIADRLGLSLSVRGVWELLRRRL
jgi:putative transposase